MHFECRLESLESDVSRERQNIQYAAIHLMDRLETFMLECENQEIKKTVEREMKIFQNFIIQIYCSLDYLKKVLYPKEWILYSESRDLK